MYELSYRNGGSTAYCSIADNNDGNIENNCDDNNNATINLRSPIPVFRFPDQIEPIPKIETKIETATRIDQSLVLWADLKHKYQRSRPNHSNSGQSFIFPEPQPTIDLLFNSSNYLNSSSIIATVNMGPEFLTMLALSALACASAIAIANETSTAVGACYWSGTSPFCAGSCDRGYEDCGTDDCGDGACCWTGYKKYCCRGGCPDRKALQIELAEGSGSPEDAVPKSEPNVGDENGASDGTSDGTSDHKE
ncbi:hypothetical protein CIB48_g392 [Xylaria polymorpha]|nr:hypothetical protein CIB48_g392 [Xylaria polymorpha]